VKHNLRDASGGIISQIEGWIHVDHLVPSKCILVEVLLPGNEVVVKARLGGDTTQLKSNTSGFKGLKIEYWRPINRDERLVARVEAYHKALLKIATWDLSRKFKVVEAKQFAREVLTAAEKRINKEVRW